VLDVGCGTGILGITAARLGAEEVICLDIDKKAVAIARENAAINHVEDRLHIVNQDASAFNEPRNLIIANLTAKLLLKLFPHLTQLLLSEGYLIISGIIEQDAKAIEENFSAAQLTPGKVITEKEWLCYVLRKKAV
jgi:ribosomal protein L11 methyltransferase